MLRTDGGLDVLIHNCADVEASAHADVALASARVLAQSMTFANRDFVAARGLEVIVRLAERAKDDTQLARAATGELGVSTAQLYGACDVKTSVKCGWIITQ